MNTGMKFTVVYATVALLVAGCGQSNSGSAGSGTNQPAAAKPVAPKDATIKVKGLYIGMDIQTVPALLKEKSTGKWSTISDVIEGGSKEAIFPATVNFYVAVNQLSLITGSGDVVPVAIVKAGPDRKAIYILLNGVIVNDLFNAADMEASAFVKQFISAYNIPEMKVSDNLQSWTYTSPDGVKVTIDTTKNVLLEKVESAQERKQSFD